MLLNQFLILSAVLFAIGVYGVLTRTNGGYGLNVNRIDSNSVNINLVAFAAFREAISGEVFALFELR